MSFADKEFDIMGIDPVKLVNSDTLEKIVLTRRVGEFLQKSTHEDQRVIIENVARKLAQDVAIKVREALAFELRTCGYLPPDLAALIATDVESVSGPFLATTTVFSDSQLAGLIPHLEEHAHIVLAKRKDLGGSTCEAIVTFGSDISVGYLVRNEAAPLSERILAKVVTRFPDRKSLMNDMSQRPDLPLSIAEAIIDKVSDRFRSLLEGHYGLTGDQSDALMISSVNRATWRLIETASPQQIHAYVGDLRHQRRLTMDLVINMAERGSIPFLESALAFQSGLTLSVVRDMMRSDDIEIFAALMKQAGMSKANAHAVLAILKEQKLR